MSKRSFRIATGIVVSTFLIAAGLGLYFYRVAENYPDERRSGTGAEIVVEIERGMSFPAIATRLANAGVIDKPRWFRIYGMRRGVTTKIRTGEYVLRDNMTPEEVVDQLLEGVEEVTVKVTVPEGLHMLEVFAIFEKAGICSASELEAIGRDPGFLQELAIEGHTIEGYLFPDTYNFKVPSEPSLVLKTLVKQHRTVWDKLRRGNDESYDKVREKLEWSDHDFLIMASIVEKEAVVDSERPRIAQVFINRLISPSFVPHRLDTDPTIRYGCTVPVSKSAACQEWDITDRLYTKQLKDADNPYNTYQHEGLPPGPICSPGAAALRAVMDPDGSKFFYFVAMDDKSHIFAKSRAEHDRNVDKYIRGK